LFRQQRLYQVFHLMGADYMFRISSVPTLVEQKELVSEKRMNFVRAGLRK
jgi:hypothetical protein